MILKNGKRLDGMGDSMPIGSIVEYNGTDIPDGWEILPGDANVYVGPVEPTEGQEIWIKRSKNLYNKYGNLNVSYPKMYPNGNTTLQSNGYVRSTSSYYFGYSPGQVIHVEKNTDYVISFEVVDRYASGGSIITIGARQSTGNFGTVFTQTFTNNLGAYSFKFNTGDFSEILVCLNGTFNSSGAGQWIDYDKVQLEKGTEKTSYEEYVEAAIYTRNDNNVLDKLLYGIIESGSNSNGSWIKYSDGRMEITKRVSGTADITTAWGAIYTSDNISLGDYPMPFIERPIVNISSLTATDSQYILTAINLSTNTDNSINIGTICILRPNSRTGTPYMFDITATGRWK